jgi:hypothetical protein
MRACTRDVVALVGFGCALLVERMSIGIASTNVNNAIHLGLIRTSLITRAHYRPPLPILLASHILFYNYILMF